MSAEGMQELGPLRPVRGQPGPLQPVTGSCLGQRQKETETQGREREGERDTHAQREAMIKVGNTDTRGVGHRDRSDVRGRRKQRLENQENKGVKPGREAKTQGWAEERQGQTGATAVKGELAFTGHPLCARHCAQHSLILSSQVPSELLQFYR